MSAAVLQIVVFSFNRGRFLAHCIRSIERCAPHARVIIFDDDSDDAETCRILSDLGARYTVWRPSADVAGGSKHGGLYANMQAALEGLDDEVLLCTLQDDMQLVRPLAPEEVGAMASWLSSSSRHGFLHHPFMKGAEKGKMILEWLPEQDIYQADRGKAGAGSHYSDIFLARVGTLRAAGWQFRGRESANEQQAREHFGPMGYWRDPFSAWLPAAPAWRGKRRTLALRAGERRRNCGFHPFRLLSEEDTRRFRDREPASELPWAEDWLELEDGCLAEPWIYHPLQGSRWLKWLNSLELKLRGLFGAGA